MIKQENNITKLINFHWVFIKRNPILWTLASLCGLSQLLIVLVLDILNKQISDYSLLLFLVPNILYTIFVIFLIYNLFQTNKDNSIDNKLLCSKYNFYKIKLARFSLIWILLGSIIVVSDLGLFYFPIKNQTILGLAVFICNTFITPFIFLLITILFTVIAIKTPTSVYMIVTVLFCVITFGLSLITRLLVPNVVLNQNDYYKLIQKDNQYLVEKTKTEINLNKAITTNTFVPSEWFYSLYSSVFAMTNTNDSSQLSIRSIYLKEVEYNDVLTNNLPIMIRESDIDFLSLSNHDYIDLICNNIQKIVNKHRLLENVYLAEHTKEYIANNFEWTDIPSQAISNLLIDITGINTEYNQLYYLIKYHQLLNLDLNILANNISERFNVQISELFKTLVESESTYYNLFKAIGIFNSLKIYPNEYSVNKYQPITVQDKNFIKTSLIKFTNNSIYYLRNDGNYYGFNLDVLTEIEPSIINEETYKNYIDELSLSYERMNDFLSKIQLKLKDMLNYKLSNNYINLNSIYKVYKYESSTNVSNIEIFIGLIIFFNAISCISFFINWKGAKNE
ncbi:MAG: hypothetical protein K2K73_03215 [Ureaplasma sp.]|nr:hypothetical protein [Ureaplasma sp.]